MKTSESFRRASLRIAKAAHNVSGGVGPGLRQIGEEIMTDVKASRAGHGVPVREGTLRNTGRVEGPDDEVKPRVELSFGGAAAPYALVQHERLDFHHTVGEARYLVRGVERWQPGESRAMDELKRNAQAGLDAAGQGA